MSLRVTVHPGAAAFLERAEPWLVKDEAEHNLILDVATALAASDPPASGAFFATVEEEGRVAGAAFRTPPQKLVVTRMPPGAVPELMEAVGRRYRSIPAVLGPEEVAHLAAEAWTRIRGGRWRPGMRQRLYRLDAVVPPPPIPGSVRFARPDEVELVTRWMEAFAAETGSFLTADPGHVAAWVGEGSVLVFDDGGPVSVARVLGGSHGGMRVGYVYTPPEHRRRGYATSLVAGVSRMVLDLGFRYCVLYTDLANPVSNGIYRRIGYRPLADVVDADVEPAEGGQEGG